MSFVENWVNRAVVQLRLAKQHCPEPLHTEIEVLLKDLEQRIDMYKDKVVAPGTLTAIDPLNAEECAHVERVLVQVFKDLDVTNMHMHPHTFMKALGWPQRRIGEVRAYISTPEAGTSLSEVKGIKLCGFMSLKHISFSDI